MRPWAAAGRLQESAARADRTSLARGSAAPTARAGEASAGQVRPLECPMRLWVVAGWPRGPVAALALGRRPGAVPRGRGTVGRGRSAAPAVGSLQIRTPRVAQRRRAARPGGPSLVARAVLLRRAAQDARPLLGRALRLRPPTWAVDPSLSRAEGASSPVRPRSRRRRSRPAAPRQAGRSSPGPRTEGRGTDRRTRVPARREAGPARRTRPAGPSLAEPTSRHRQSRPGVPYPADSTTAPWAPAH